MLKAEVTPSFFTRRIDYGQLHKGFFGRVCDTRSSGIQ